MSTLEEKREAALAFLRRHTLRGYVLDVKHTKARHQRMTDQAPQPPAIPQSVKVRRIR